MSAAPATAAIPAAATFAGPGIAAKPVATLLNTVESFILPTASTILPIPIVALLRPFAVAPIATIEAPTLTKRFLLSSSMLARFWAKSLTPVLTSLIVGSIVSPMPLAASTRLFLVIWICPAVVSAILSASFCRAVFSDHAVLERSRAEVIMS